jgi:hypothetical protein
MFESPERLLLGLLTGVAFGFLLHKGQVTKFGTIVKQFLLKDFTVLKVMLTAVVVGGLGVYAIVGLDQAALHVKPLVLGGVLAGGLFFGIGMSLLGYCPGTGVAAIAQGSRHAIFGVLGMFAGAALYAEVHPLLKSTLYASNDYGKMTLDTAFGISPWLVLAGITVLALAVFAVIEVWQRGGFAGGRNTERSPAGQATATGS